MVATVGTLHSSYTQLWYSSLGGPWALGPLRLAVARHVRVLRRGNRKSSVRSFNIVSYVGTPDGVGEMTQENSTCTHTIHTRDCDNHAPWNSSVSTKRTARTSHNEGTSLPWPLPCAYPSRDQHTDTTTSVDKRAHDIMACGLWRRRQRPTPIRCSWCDDAAGSLVDRRGALRLAWRCS